jgi:hypothetical protein
MDIESGPPAGRSIPGWLHYGDDLSVTAMAEGILQERYRASHELAVRLLTTSAAAANLRVADAARWLLRTRNLPPISAATP